MGFTDLLMANSIVGIFKSIIFTTVGFQDVFVSFIHHFPRGMALPSPTAGGQRAIIVRIIFNESDPKLLGVVVSRARNAPAMNAHRAGRPGAARRANILHNDMRAVTVVLKALGVEDAPQRCSGRLASCVNKVIDTAGADKIEHVDSWTRSGSDQVNEVRAAADESYAQRFPAVRFWLKRQMDQRVTSGCTTESPRNLRGKIPGIELKHAEAKQLVILVDHPGAGPQWPDINGVTGVNNTPVFWGYSPYL